MGEAKRRAAFKQQDNQSEDAPLKWDHEAIADAVQAVKFEMVSAGGKCAMRNLLGAAVLRELGYKVEVITGGALYRAGHHPQRDVVAFCGRGNAGMILNGAHFLGHYYLKVRDGGRDYLVDFSPADWPSTTMVDGDAAADVLGALVWEMLPPKFYWRLWRDQIALWRSTGEPDLGACWHAPWGKSSPRPPWPTEIENSISFCVRQVADAIRNDEPAREINVLFAA